MFDNQHHPHPEEARRAVSKDGNEHLACCPSFETLAEGACECADSLPRVREVTRLGPG